MNFAILRTQKLKTFANVKGCSDHHNRSRKTENANPDIENELLIGSGDPYLDAKKRIEESGAHYRSNSNKAIEVLLTATPDYFRPDMPDKAGYWQEQPTNAFKAKATEWLQEYFGKENVVSVILHLDESTPHIQAVVTPIDTTPRAKGPQVRLNAKKWTGNSIKLAKMQDSFANAVSSLGLQRGIKGSTAKHTKVKKFYGNMQKNNASLKNSDFIIQKPNFFNTLTNKQKQKYIDEQQNSIISNIKPTYIILKNQANIAVIANKKRKEYQKTASKLQAENEAINKRLEQIENVQIMLAQLKAENDFINYELDVALNTNNKLQAKLNYYNSTNKQLKEFKSLFKDTVNTNVSNAGGPEL